ncbi:hypothetical protein JCM19379_21420 [Methyloparacoccus murrellii]|jgi:hypothetical protein
MPAPNPTNPLSTRPPGDPAGQPADLGQLHVNAGLLVERYLEHSDPCIAVWLSRQFRLIAESPAMPDAELKVLYRTLAARWHQMATQALIETLPRKPWLDEFAGEARS